MQDTENQTEKIAAFHLWHKGHFANLSNQLLLNQKLQVLSFMLNV